MAGQLEQNQATVRLLLRSAGQQQQRDSLNAVNYDGWSAALLAASRGMDVILTALLQAGARHDITREKGETALHMAALAGEPECVLALLQVFQMLTFSLKNNAFSI